MHPIIILIIPMQQKRYYISSIAIKPQRLINVLGYPRSNLKSKTDEIQILIYLEIWISHMA